jgi:hypothetical protein
MIPLAGRRRIPYDGITCYNSLVVKRCRIEVGIWDAEL